ncbi:hypothetical protein F5J12DRAFT_259179 [Pisolithus orientalis]|uniref:uncharacterized protein n=1 Tax=Pisolithus orientalis TaxID=936130 RepID=UPI0022244028|nr:uncharacterized protein F5J12DRAFT_259179 [Pisolithus orientalis]KAI6000400.1 hypothetical protein F5J12DRAFT_259179 [Pisolithus orientalis]
MPHSYISFYPLHLSFCFVFSFFSSLTRLNFASCLWSRMGDKGRPVYGVPSPFGLLSSSSTGLISFSVTIHDASEFLFILLFACSLILLL